MWNWLKKRALPALWRMELEARVDLCEAQLADLRARFTRFQNRENMRKARDSTEQDDALAKDALEVMERPTESAKPQSAAKLELWKQRRH